MTGKAFILLPAYNEEKALAGLIPDIAEALKRAAFSWEILVINDGSKDGTLALIDRLAKSIPVRAISHPVNRGYGAALATGFRWVADNGAEGDGVVSLDADRTHLPVYIPSMFQKLDEGFDVVTASYVMDGGAVSGVPVLRRLMSGVINQFFRMAFPTPGVETYTNGFRAYRVAILRNVQKRFGAVLIEETGFPGGVELFLKACAVGGRAAEVPFHLHYENRGGDSKIRLVHTITQYLQLLQKARSYRS